MPPAGAEIQIVSLLRRTRFAGTNEEFRDVAWGAVFSFVLAVAASILGALAATRDEIRSRWSLYR